MTSSGRVAPISVGDTVLVVKDVKYRVQNLLPSDGTVVLQKINTRDRPFKRFISQLWVPPPSIHDAVADVDMTFAHCLCPEPELTRLLPDNCDSITQVDIPSASSDLDKWCSLMTDYTSVDHLQQAFDEARNEARTYFDLNSQLLTDMAAVRQEAEEAVAPFKAQIQTLQQDNKHLRSSLANLNATHNSLMAHCLSQTEQIGELRSRLPDKQPPLPPFLRTLLLTLPTDFSDDTTPDDSLYYFLCADPAADQTTLASNASTLLHLLHPDKRPNPDEPAVKAAAHLVPLITHINRVLTIPALRLVYDHCGLTGLQGLLNHKLCCIPSLVAFIRCTSTRTRGISSATSFVNVQSLDLLPCPVRRRFVAWDRKDEVCWIPLPLFASLSVLRVCLVSCILLLRDPCSVFSSRACYIQMFIFGASSFAAAINTLSGGVFRRRRHLTALPGSHLIHASAKFRHKTLQHQLRLVQRFQSNNTHYCRPKIILWHDVINNSLTPHSSNFNNPLSPTALIQEPRPLPCDIAAIVYCQRKGSPDVFQLVRQSFLVINPVRHFFVPSQKTQSCSCSTIQCLSFSRSSRTENLFFVVTTPSSINDFDSQEIQTLTIDAVDLYTDAPSLTNYNSPRKTVLIPSPPFADTVNTSHTSIFPTPMPILPIFFLLAWFCRLRVFPS